MKYVVDTNRIKFHGKYYNRGDIIEVDIEKYPSLMPKLKDYIPETTKEKLTNKVQRWLRNTKQ